MSFDQQMDYVVQLGPHVIEERDCAFVDLKGKYLALLNKPVGERDVIIISGPEGPSPSVVLIDPNVQGLAIKIVTKATFNSQQANAAMRRTPLVQPGIVPSGLRNRG
ncbi:MAG: hypothetical protein V3R34_08840 [Hyphomicrobium sp.]